MSNLYFHPLQGTVAARLVRVVGSVARLLLQQRNRSRRSMPQVRAAVLARAGRTRRARVSSHSRRSFAGRTMGSLSVTWDEHYRGAVSAAHPRRHLCHRRRSRCRASAVTSATAAVIAEPIQGEGGVRPLPARDGGGDRGGVRAHRHAAHRGRSPVRTRAVPASRSHFRRSVFSPT